MGMFLTFFSFFRSYNPSIKLIALNMSSISLSPRFYFLNVIEP